MHFTCKCQMPLSSGTTFSMEGVGSEEHKMENRRTEADISGRDEADRNELLEKIIAVRTVLFCVHF